MCACSATSTWLGVIWGSHAAVEAMRSGPGDNRHIVNIASLSALMPVPGLAIYSATKHGVLGFTGSLQGDLMDAGIPITVHALCPDAADTAAPARARPRARGGDQLVGPSAAQRQRRSPSTPWPCWTRRSS